MDEHKLTEELRVKAKELSIPIYQEDEESYLRDRSSSTVDNAQEWLDLHGEALVDRRAKELEGFSSSTGADYKASLAQLTGVNIDEVKIPELEMIKVPDDIDWEQSFKAISELSDEEWYMATTKLEEEERSPECQTKREKEWQLAEED